MLEIKNVGYIWMAKCKQLTSLPFKGLKLATVHELLPLNLFVV